MSQPQETSFSIGELPAETLAFVRQNLSALQTSLEQHESASLRFEQGTELRIPAPLLPLIVHALTRAAEGKRLILFAEDAEVPLQTAAKFLRVSPGFVQALLAKGELTTRPGDLQQNLRLADLLNWKERRQERSRKTLGEMREEAEELGLYE